MSFEPTRYLEEGGIIDYDPIFLSSEESNFYLNHFLEEVSWEQREYINLHTGIKIKIPRLLAHYFEDPEIQKKFLGKAYKIHKFTPILTELKDKVERATEAKYNSILLTLYRDGNDCVGFHADDEKELGPEPKVASISLGATRTFVLRKIKTLDTSNKLDDIRYDLLNGSLIVMSGKTQQFWNHSIIKTDSLSNINSYRLNISFRNHAM